MKKFLLPIGIFVFLGYLLARGLDLDPHRIPSPLVGKPLPTFSLPVLGHPEQIWTNANLKGKPALINVWASWCVACKEEHEVLLEFAQRKLVPLIGLNYKDKDSDGLSVLAQMGNPYDTVLVDASGRTGIDWGVYGVPETFVVDKNGIIRYKFIGPISQQDITQKLLPLLQKL